MIRGIIAEIAQWQGAKARAPFAFYGLLCRWSKALAV